MNILLWLDDTRNPAEYAPKWDGEIVWVKNYDDFSSYLENNPMPTMISFDYMLGTGENMFTDGIGCAKAVIRKCDNDEVAWPRWRIHSTFERVSKLRKYIEHAIHIYDFAGDDSEQPEEDRQPNTPEQNAYEHIQDVVFNKTRSVGITQVNSPEPQRGITIVKSKTQGRNEPCNCASGKKYKHCCGK